MTKSLYYTEQLELRALLLELGSQIDALKKEIADLKNDPQPASMLGEGQLGLFGVNQGHSSVNWSRIQFLETLLLQYLKEFSRATQIEQQRRINSMTHVEIAVVEDCVTSLSQEVVQLVNNLGGEEKQSLAQQIVERFNAVRWR